MAKGCNETLADISRAIKKKLSENKVLSYILGLNENKNVVNGNFSSFYRFFDEFYRGLF